VAGSGPTAFGLYRTEAEAGSAAEQLRERFPDAIATRPLSS
jgi:4-diphosphocytidyl-2C-methyl-D-erythritol kinase